MARNPRCLLTSIPYHVTQRGNNRQDVFYSQQDREVYLDLVERERSEARVRLLAYALMTNHVHWLVEPERGDSLAVFFRRVHGRYAHYITARRGRSGHLWQGRFHACIVEPRRLEVALRYVERNPVRAGLAAEPGAYEWSSARAHLTGHFGREVFLDQAFWSESGGAEFWCRMLEPAGGIAEDYELRRCTYAGHPFGDEAFLVEMEHKFGRAWKRWPFVKECSGEEVPAGTGRRGTAGAGQ